MPKRFQVRGGFPAGVLVDQCDRWLGDKYTWHINQDGYVVTYIRNGADHFCLRLHVAIMNPQRGELVDHIHHNKLDCRRSEMRNVPTGINNFNREGAPSQSTTKARNVHRMKDGSFTVQVQFRGRKLRSQKRGLTIEQAIRLAAEFREEILR
jgi:hypothetical protein